MLYELFPCKVAFVLAFVFLAATPARTWAHPPPSRFSRVAHYIRTHKELLTADALIIAAESGDAWSSARCQENNPVTCIERNPIVGKHPSAAVTWTWAMSIAGGFVTGNHLIYHFAPEPLYRHMIWITTAPLVIFQAFNVPSNVQAGNLAAARARLAQ